MALDTASAMCYTLTMSTALADSIREMNKPLTKHQIVLQFAAWGWSPAEIAESVEMDINVIKVVIRSPLGQSVIESLKNGDKRTELAV